MSDTTISYNGKTADLRSTEAKKLMGEAVGNAVGVPPRGESARVSDEDGLYQASLLDLFPDMDEHAGMVIGAVQNFASEFPYGAASGASTKMLVTFFTANHRLMEGELTISFKAKPKKISL